MKRSIVFSGILVLVLGGFGSGFWCGFHGNPPPETARERKVLPKKSSDQSISKTESLRNVAALIHQQEALVAELRTQMERATPVAARLQDRKRRLESIIDYMQRPEIGEEELLNVAMMSGSPDAIQKVLPQRAETEMEMDQLLDGGLGSHHPRLIAMSRRLDDYVSTLSFEVGKIYQALKSQLHETKRLLADENVRIEKAGSEPGTSALLSERLRAAERELKDLKEELVVEKIEAGK